jgi:predicted nuclease of predicted toxin-antitoxin system
MIKFVADEGVDAPIVRLLRQNGFDVFYIAEESPSIDDTIVLKIANTENRILITKDKDFGELVYRLRQVHTGVVLTRLEGLKPQLKAEIVLSVIQERIVEMRGSFTVIQPGAVRIRKF